MMARRLAQRDMREIAPRRNITMRLARDELYQSVQMQYQALETRLSVVEARLQLTQPEQQASTSASVAAPRRLAAPLASRGYLIKDIDSFAGFAHAINTYLAGVALADVHGRQLLYMPFRAAHGLEYAFDDFLTSDPRGLAPPLAAPRLALRDDAQLPLINGLPASLLELTKGRSADQIAQRLRGDNAPLVAWVRKGRFAFVDGCNCSFNAEERRAGPQPCRLAALQPCSPAALQPAAHVMQAVALCISSRGA